MKKIHAAIKLSVIACTLLCALSPIAQAEESMPAMPHMEREQFGTPMPGFLRGLALNEVQRDEIFTIMHDKVPMIRQKMKSLHASQEALRTLAFSGRFDEARARTLAESAAKDMAELAMLNARADQMIYTLLTSEQRKQLEDMKEGKHEGGRLHPAPR